MEINLGKVWAVEEPHGHVGGDGRPHGQGVDGHGDGDQLGDGLGVVEGPHVHVGGDGRPQGEGVDGHGDGDGTTFFVVRIAILSSE